MDIIDLENEITEIRSKCAGVHEYLKACEEEGSGHIYGHEVVLFDEAEWLRLLYGLNRLEKLHNKIRSDIN